MQHEHRHYRGRFIVDCPACLGTGKVARPDSIVLHGCMLCWERGVVSRISAERWRKRDDPSDDIR
jgi:hypothetical protein